MSLYFLLALLDLFSGLITLDDAANLRNPRSGEFAMKQRAEHEKNNKQRADREYTGKEPERMKNCCGLHQNGRKRSLLLEPRHSSNSPPLKAILT